jgi:hypothetical protein
MSEDPKLFDAGDYNLFRYCHNDPIDMTDPMGLETDYAQTGAPVSGNHVAQEMYAEQGPNHGGNAQWAMAKWADSSNTFQGTFANFAGGQGLTMGQTTSNRAQSSHINRVYDLPTKGTPQALAQAAARKAADEYETTGDSYGYTAFRENGQTQWFKSVAGVWERGQWIERTYVPKSLPNEAFIANGHVHPKPDVLHHEYPGQYRSFSAQDRLLSRFGPVWKRNWEIHRDVRYDQVLQGVETFGLP